MGRYIVHDQSKIDDAWGEYNLGVAQMPGANRAFWQGRGSAVSPIPQDELARLTPPTLVIWGHEDRLFPVTGAKAALRIILGAKLHVLSDAGHRPCLEQPAEFNQMLLSFRDELERTGSSL